MTWETTQEGYQRSNNGEEVSSGGLKQNMPMARLKIGLHMYWMRKNELAKEINATTKWRTLKNVK